MEKIKVKVFSSSGATFMNAELCLSSGIIEHEDGYSHISAMANQGRRVEKVVVVIPEPVTEEVKVITPPQSEAPKKKKPKG
jgi:hypothetical protein